MTPPYQDTVRGCHTVVLAANRSARVGCLVPFFGLGPAFALGLRPRRLVVARASKRSREYQLHGPVEALAALDQDRRRITAIADHQDWALGLPTADPFQHEPGPVDQGTGRLVQPLGDLGR